LVPERVGLLEPLVSKWVEALMVTATSVGLPAVVAAWEIIVGIGGGTGKEAACNQGH